MLLDLYSAAIKPPAAAPPPAVVDVDNSKQYRLIPIGNMYYLNVALPA